MIKCDVEDCNWIGYQVNIHKSLKHGSLLKIKSKQSPTFKKIDRIISTESNSLSIEEINSLVLTLKDILEKCHEKILTERREQDQLYKDTIRQIEQK